MKNLKKVLALVLAVVMIMGVVSVASAKTYKDVDSTNTYADAIDALSSLSILDGFEDETFKSEGTLTRAQAAKIVAIVHNAATNGKIKDQTAISALYSNAQNPFVDCNNSWALPFINYCRITGLADGMTATTYAPNRELTGVQWLKLMLTTLNFDTAKEGYTGTGWDVNVLNRANEIGLTAGLADGWKAIAPITRGEAAQILYNALTKYLVEYGQLVKHNTADADYAYKSSFISNEQVAKSGYTLGGKMGIKITRTTDSFRRPGYAWSYGSWSAFYMDTPVNSYTTAVTMCDILKNDMGVKETSSTEVKLDGEGLNYVAVDGYKWGISSDTPAVTLKHDSSKNCQKNTGLWYTSQFGGQGDLTQVFETEAGWVITTIHTFLAEVDSFTATNKYSHATTDKATAKVWLSCDSDPAYGNVWTTAQKSISTTDYAKGTKILVTMSLKDTETANLDRDYAQYAKIVNVTAAESKVGKLTGASDYTYPETVSIDGTKYSTNCRFVLGKEASMNITNSGKTYNFYFDSYGNVIGRDDSTGATASYVVMDRIYGDHENGKFVIKADLVDLDGKKTEAATVAVAGSFAGAKDGYDIAGSYSGEWFYLNSPYIFMVDAHNDANLINALYSYTLSDKGVYTLTWVGEANINGTSPFAFARLQGSFTHTAKLAYLRGTGVGSVTHTGTAIQSITVDQKAVYDISLSESTKFVVKSAGGEWTSYTGYTALPALTASYVDYVDTDADGYADIVYLGNAVFAADNVTGWVLKWTPFNWANGYDLITVYVNGEAVTVNVKHSTIIDGRDSDNVPLQPGLYTFTTQVDSDGVTYSEVYRAAEGTAQWSGEAVESYSADATAIKVVNDDNYTQTIGLTDVVIYNVLNDGTVVKADASCIAKGDKIIYSAFANKYSAPYAAIYVHDQM